MKPQKDIKSYRSLQEAQIRSFSAGESLKQHRQRSLFFEPDNKSYMYNDLSKVSLICKLIKCLRNIINSIKIYKGNFHRTFCNSLSKEVWAPTEVPIIFMQCCFHFSTFSTSENTESRSEQSNATAVPTSWIWSGILAMFQSRLCQHCNKNKWPATPWLPPPKGEKKIPLAS